MRAVILASRPVGAVAATDFAVVDISPPAPGEGQILVDNLFLSLDPGIRNLLGADEGYIAPLPVGEPLVTTVVGRVAMSRHPKFVRGDLVVGRGTTAEQSAFAPDAMCWKIDPATMASLSNALSVQGATGLTAYFGLIEIGRPMPGETVLVSGAAGAVGSIAGQIARIKGCRTVGIAGGSFKAQRLIEEFGFDAAIDYKGKSREDLTREIRAACPQGVDVYFDNVGGEQLDAAIDCMNWGGRIAVCGLISQYDGQEPPRMHNLFKIVAKTLRIEGFLMFTFGDRFPQAIADLGGWVADGRIRFREEIAEGLDQIPSTFLRLFEGSNQGKTIIRL